VTRLIPTLNLTKLRNRIALAVLAAGCAFASVPTASAQFGGRSGMASMFTPDFLPRDLPIFVDALSLEEWQRPVLEVLLQDYDTDFNTAADGVRAKMASLKEVAAGANAERVLEMISEPLVAWTAEKKRLREDFLAGVRGTLGDTQVENWPRLERALRREKSLPLGELSGESIDLTIIVREVQPSPLALDEARNAIERYEVALDAALAVRDEALDSAIAPLLRAMSTSDANSGVAAQEAIMQKRVVVRGAQEAGIAAIRDALGGEYGPAFERRALEKSFPQVFRPDPITPLIEGAQALPDLTDDQKTQLSALSAQYGFDLNGVRSALVDAYKVAEPSEPRRRTELARQKAEDQTVRLTDAPQVEQAKKAREDLYEKYRNLLAGILSPEQRTAVPGFVKESLGDAEKEAAVREQARAIRAGQGGGGGGGGGTQGLRGDPSAGKPSNEKPQQPGRPADSGFGANPPTVPPKSVD
jgi:Spy/CpxP family protein refolding chaperone